MFKTLKMKIAARRMERRGAAKKSSKRVRKNSFWARVWNAICTPFRAMGRWLRAFWVWVRSIDLIGLVNITLLSAIIVLFSMLIMDIIGYNKKPVVIIAKNKPEQINVAAIEKPTTIVRNRNENEVKQIASLPLKKDCARQFISNTINVAHVQPDTTAIKQTARVRNVMYGDVIIDSRGAATMLKQGDVVKGNLYLQNMRKYILPRGIRIEGNLFLRDMGMLQFAGEFTVTGNIYVTPTSSFGPIPGTARIGGQVIL